MPGSEEDPGVNSGHASPFYRASNVTVRTAHIGVMGTLFGGHLFGVSPERLLPWLFWAIATGAALLVVEAYPVWWRWCFQGSGLMTLAKIVLLCLIPAFWEERVPILTAVIVLGSVGSHMPRRLRRYSVLPGRQADA